MRKPTAGEGWNREKVYEIFPALKDIDCCKGGYLSGGEQKMLAVARGVVRNYNRMMTSEKNISWSDLGAEKGVDFPCSV